MNPLIQRLKDAILEMPNAAFEWSEFRGETTFSLSKEVLLSVCQNARDHVGFDMLLDIATIDWLGEEPRFQLVYELYHLREGVHLRIKTRVEENESVPSLVTVWPAADWLEREAYDMMGIKFEGHPDLTRILMWEGYPYYPLRKDFALQGQPSEADEIAFSEEAPLGGGPFVTVPCQGTTEVREPRARSIERIPESI